MWPLSRQNLPKQFLPITGKQSLLQQTATRVSSEQFAPAIIVSSEAHHQLVQRQLEQAGTSPEAILLEPSQRNTSAAAALAAAWLRGTGRDELLLIMPSDHVIGDLPAFLKAIGAGARHARDGAIVTFGIAPSGPNPQYGYIETDADASSGALRIKRFVEKPSAERASEYLASGRHFWNSGIFLVSASTLLDEMGKFLPATLDAVSRSVGDATAEGLFIRPAADAFNEAENISIDHGIMERTALGMVVPVEMKWSDVGSWNAVWELADKDGNNNAAHGNVLALDTRNSLLRNDSRTIVATLGLDNMAVIATGDAIFIAPLSRASDVRRVVESLGSDSTVTEDTSFRVRHIVVDPGQELPIQPNDPMHWVVVRGSARVTAGDGVRVLEQNQSAQIAAGTIANGGDSPLELIAVQCGPDEQR